MKSFEESFSRLSDAGTFEEDGASQDRRAGVVRVLDRMAKARRPSV